MQAKHLTGDNAIQKLRSGRRTRNTAVQATQTQSLLGGDAAKTYQDTLVVTAQSKGQVRDNVEQTSCS
jgi:hypothetical protein